MIGTDHLRDACNGKQLGGKSRIHLSRDRRFSGKVQRHRLNEGAGVWLTWARQLDLSNRIFSNGAQAIATFGARVFAGYATSISPILRGVHHHHGTGPTGQPGLAHQLFGNSANGNDGGGQGTVSCMWSSRPRGRHVHVKSSARPRGSPNSQSPRPTRKRTGALEHVAVSSTSQYNDPFR